MFLAFQYFYFLFLNMQVSQRFCLRQLQTAWLHLPGAELLGLFKVQELISYLGLCSSQLGDKTQQWLVLQLVK